ncbi:MAG: hypothetical protein U1E73_05220 [Planctomycetota bacterium]
MEARTRTELAILALGSIQACIAVSVLPVQDFTGVRILDIGSYLVNGWRLPGTILFGLCSVGISLLLLFNEPRRKPIASVLRCLWEAAFDAKKLDGNLLSHKVTYFALRPRRNPIGLGSLLRWLTKDRAQLKLVPRYRYPLEARRPKRSFRVDKHDICLCEGVAGLVFSAGTGRVITKSNLPGLSSTSSYEDFANFATQTNDNPERVKSHHHYDMRSIGGLQVLAGGDSRIVGVLMFDSSVADAVEGIAGKNTVQAYLKALSRIVDS